MCFDCTDCRGSFFAEGTRGGVEWNAMWTLSADNRLAMFTVMARTTGWVAIGFSEDQFMVSFTPFKRAPYVTDALLFPYPHSPTQMSLWEQ